MDKQDLALNNLQTLKCHKTKLTAIILFFGKKYFTFYEEGFLSHSDSMKNYRPFPE